MTGHPRSLRATLGVRPLEWHSELTPRTVPATGRRSLPASAVVVGGARPCSCPMRIRPDHVDEEHDQPTSRMTARIITRAHGGGARAYRQNPIILPPRRRRSRASQCGKGRYQRIALPSRLAASICRYRGDRLRREPPPRGRLVSPRLADYIGRRSRSATALLFLNRRGYAPLTLWPRLRHRFACHLRAWWWIIALPSLVCQHCASRCRARTSVRMRGRGIAGRGRPVWNACGGAASCSNARTWCVARPDHLDRNHAQRLNEIAEGRVDIIIGTQLVAKGHNFPRLNLVGVVVTIGPEHAIRVPRADVSAAQPGDRPRRARAGRGIGYCRPAADHP